MRSAIYILGISCFYHNSAAAIVKDGEIVAACQEERFTRIKQDGSFPFQSIKYCLEEAGINVEEINVIACVPFGLGRNVESEARLAIRRELGYKGKVVFPSILESHAFSAFFPSPYREAAIMIIGGAGERATAGLGSGSDGEVRIRPLMKSPHSQGAFYSACTGYAGFKINSGEYKMMGLAPYGASVYKDLILKKLIDLKEDGSFGLRTGYFDLRGASVSLGRRFYKLSGIPKRAQDTAITRQIKDFASSVQKVAEEIMVRMARRAEMITSKKNLVLAGESALNCVGNGRILCETSFKNIWVQPASGEAGAALGAALSVWSRAFKSPRKADGVNDRQKGSLLGPSHSNDEIEIFLRSASAEFVKLDDKAIVGRTADMIAKGKVVGWFQGRMEFGPRSLGARSILADARNAAMQNIINKGVKFREPFRPFAPSVLEERVSDYFDLGTKSPYMALVAPVRADKREAIPAVTHIDASARVQTVSRRWNAPYYDLIKKFYEKYGCPVIINTSFNAGEEPIVQSPSEAYSCFMRTKMDCLAIGNFFLEKKGNIA